MKTTRDLLNALKEKGVSYRHTSLPYYIYKNLQEGKDYYGNGRIALTDKGFEKIYNILLTKKGA